VHTCECAHVCERGMHVCVHVGGVCGCAHLCLCLCVSVGVEVGQENAVGETPHPPLGWFTLNSQVVDPNPYSVEAQQRGISWQNFFSCYLCMYSFVHSFVHLWQDFNMLPRVALNSQSSCLCLCSS
jgi:hypothetical protein